MNSRCLLFLACCIATGSAAAAEALTAEVDASNSINPGNPSNSDNSDNSENPASIGPAIEAREGVSPLQVRNAMAAEEQQYLILIEQRQEAGGLMAPDLVEPLTALGDMYFSYRDFDRAFEAYADARQVMRVNAGFDTLPELPLIAKLVRTEESRGRIAEAWELEQALVTLAERNAGRIETLDIFRELADKRFDVFLRHAAGEIPPQIELGCYYARREFNATMGAMLLTNDNRGMREQCSAGDRGVARLALLLEGRSYQIRALEALLQNGAYATDEFRDQFTAVLETSYAVMRRARGYADTPLASLMVKLLTYQATSAEERIQRAQILVQLADMNVVRARHLDRYVGFDTVRVQYEQAYGALLDEGFTQQALDDMFAPSSPITLPTFIMNPLVTSADAGIGGYIDLSFEITRQGKARRVKVTAASANVDRVQRRELERLVSLATFRPRLQDGEVVDNAPVSLRYYLGSALGPAAQTCDAEDEDACESFD